MGNRGMVGFAYGKKNETVNCRGRGSNSHRPGGHICFSAKKEDLARDLIRRKLEAERQLHATEQQSKANQASIKILRQRLDENHQALDSMEQKLDLLADNTGCSTGEYYSGASVRSEEIEIALLREKQKRAAS